MYEVKFMVTLKMAVILYNSKFIVSFANNYLLYLVRLL